MTTAYWDSSHAALQTPEQVELRLEIAHIGSRALALMVDMVLRNGVLLLIWTAITLSASAGVIDVTALGLGFDTVMLALGVVVLATEWFYFAAFEWWWNGQTPGKCLLGLRVIKIDGTPASPFEIILRNLTRPFDTLGPMALIGLASLFTTRRAQRLGDIIARTIVIRETQIDWSQFGIDDNDIAPACLDGSPGLSTLTASDTASASATNDEPDPQNQIAPSRESAKSRIPLPPADWELLHRYLGRAEALSGKQRESLAANLRNRLKDHAAASDLANNALDDHDWLTELSRRQ